MPGGQALSGQEQGDAIAARALALLGTPFRLGGRDPARGIDCIGLAALAVGGLADIPSGYRLRSIGLTRWRSWFAAHDFTEVAGKRVPGDLCLAMTAPLQAHLLVAVKGGFVHAHAGLRRTLFLPGQCPWPIDSTWRARSD